MTHLVTADLFCGAGGFTTGLLRAARDRALPITHTAINHWPVAIATHQQNHPTTHHKKDQVKQIGNAVSVRTATALCSAILDTLS